ncbi:hypothetical protein MKS88_003263 [Plasmodium brasilianum]|uniref:Uncharacterized protein n=2 Tax=Plasmodium (Plasmodium) TaxID=418103 RepID=A0A1A8W3Z9_PLAMA|nr:conserved Plasmodium protein, unknown function [Plasmodium malariae]KAI4837845.1 hypothetical protein MKS88_003263 [Plasmodium brasilianum]SBS86388.1 conserved Plasmodium protein, unknown function [Plasmodium malariae]SCN44932.1 conserved Plasmodium protein, unknown function [Plasmodium malariae]
MPMLLLFFSVVALLLNKGVQTENDISVKGSLTVANLQISSKDNRENGITFWSEGTEYKLGLNAQNEFMISKKNKPLISIDEHDNLNFLNPDLSVKVLNIEGNLKIRSISQFQLVVHENFANSSNTKGWSGENFDNFTSICGGIHLLGGYGKLSKGRIYKTFENIPSHTQIRIKCNFHFIDNWNNQTAYLKIGRDEKEDLFYVWTDTHSQVNKENSINICGNSTGESKFFSLIDVIIPHNSSKLIVEFGTNIQKDDPNDISWGISNFQLFIV